MSREGGGVQFPGEPKSGGHVTIAHQIASTFQVVHTTSLLRSDKILQICAGLFCLIFRDILVFI